MPLGTQLTTLPATFNPAAPNPQCVVRSFPISNLQLVYGFTAFGTIAVVLLLLYRYAPNLRSVYYRVRASSVWSRLQFWPVVGALGLLTLIVLRVVAPHWFALKRDCGFAVGFGVLWFVVLCFCAVRCD
jgi:hypothetical protein